MRKLALLLLALLALGGFYVAWPAWSGYKISEALKQRDARALERKVDFPSVRDGMRPVLAEEMNKQFDRLQQQAGPLGGAFAQSLRKDLGPRLIETVLQNLVTADGIVDMAQRSGSLRQMIDRSMQDQIGKAGSGPPGGAGAGAIQLPGGLGGIFGRGRPVPEAPAPSAAPTPAPAAPAAASTTGMGETPKARPKYSAANIKHFRITGPFSFEVGVNRNPAATEPEMIAEMAFRNFDWRVVRVIPRLDR